MDHVGWQSRFEIGDELLDAEHKQLFDKINNCIQAARHGASKHDLVGQLEEILDCLDRHFEHEEKAMLKEGYPDLRQHRAQHHYLIERLKSEIAELGNVKNKKVSAQGILFVLYDWYVTHMSVEDKKLLQ